MPESTRSFAAPWDRTLRRVTLIVALVCLGLTASLWPVIQSEGPDSIHFWGGLLPVFIVVAAAVSAVRAYRLAGDELVIERLLWNRRLHLGNLRSVHRAPQLLHQSRTVLANSGFFGFMGWFRHAEAGGFRAWVTDPARTLLLRFDDQAIAISPGSTAAFIAALQDRHPEVQVSPDENHHVAG